MKKVNGLALAVTLVLTWEGYAQSLEETALLFSRTKPAGSARIQAMGGAQVSLGGDYSSALSNPAGLGMYNRSEFTFTPGFSNSSVKGDYMQNNNLISTGNNDSRAGINLSGLSLVFSSDQAAKDRFLRGTFAVTLSRRNDFNTNIVYEGENASNSLVDYFLDDATGGDPDQFDEDGYLYNTITQLAYDNFLIGEKSIIDPDSPSDEYFSDVEFFDSKPYQRETIKTRGAQSQWSFSYGANFDDRFFLGAGIGITSLRYQVAKTYSESFKGEVLDNFKMKETLDIRGSGFNLTVGGIARPVDIVQFGLSLTTPTYYSLTDTYVADISSSWNNFDYYGDGSRYLNDESSKMESAILSEYNLSSPWRLNLGATIFVGKHGFLTADVEQVNYSQARYHSQVVGIEFSNENKKIKTLYRSVPNIRLGGEFRLKALRFRGGYQYMPDPFNTEQNNVNRSYQAISGGLGYRSSDFFIDLAVIQSAGKNSYRPYRVNSNASPLLVYDQKATNVVVTVGFNF